MKQMKRCLVCKKPLWRIDNKSGFCSSCRYNKDYLKYKQEHKILSPSEKQYLAREKIFNFIRHNKRGISQMELSKKLKMAYKTIQINIAYLEGKGRIFIKWYGSAKVCYPIKHRIKKL